MRQYLGRHPADGIHREAFFVFYSTSCAIRFYFKLKNPLK
jgi:hypothetical protein